MNLLHQGLLYKCHQRSPQGFPLPTSARSYVVGIVQVIPVHVDVGAHGVGLGLAGNLEAIEGILGKIVRVVALGGDQASGRNPGKGLLGKRFYPYRIDSTRLPE